MNKPAVFLSALAGAVVVLMTSCGKDTKDPGLEFMPDMYRSPSYEVYSSNPNFPDSLTMQAPVKGTIPRNYTYFNYPSTIEGYEAASRDVKNPLPLTEANVAEGQRLYGIYCVHCHGDNGQGDGNLVAIGKFPPPPSYSAGNSSRGGAMKDLSDGKIYHTIVYGINLMGPHATLINPEERWKIVMYVHQLQGNAATPAAGDSAVAAKDSSTTTAMAK
ncbi:MAG: cytochrome c [Bacteroidia bacterium]|nr:cytochrome c [Bacteroidia bacterium]